MRLLNMTMALLLTMGGMSGCAMQQVIGKEAAKQISGPSYLNERQLEAGSFTLTLYERIHDRGGIAHIYIEGDNEDALYEPFPDDLIGLRLASRDKADNVIYVSRPCQFTPQKKKWGAPWGTEEAPECDHKYMTTHRFSPEVVRSYNATLDELKRRWDVTGFRLYGHSGGGAIAALVAHTRSDILSLTTVSGLMDNRAFDDAKPLSKYRGKHEYFLSPLTGSMNAADVSYTLKDLPQRHYLGGVDDLMPSAALMGYLEKIGPTNCVQYQLIQENGYSDGWEEKWSDILQDKPVCFGPITDSVTGEVFATPRYEYDPLF